MSAEFEYLYVMFRPTDSLYDAHFKVRTTTRGESRSLPSIVCHFLTAA